MTMRSVSQIRLATVMRISSLGISALAALAALAACGSGSAAANVRCDAYAKPGAGTAQALVEQLRPGQTGCLRGGRYEGTGPDGYVLTPQRAGKRGKPITVRSAPGERARLRGIIYYQPGAGHHRLTHVDIDAQHPRRPADSQIGIQVLADRVTIAHSDVTTQGNQTCLIAMAGARRLLLHSNTFHDCGGVGNGITDHAIYASDTRGLRVVDNVIVRASGWAVHLYPGADNSYVARNLMWENGGAVIFAGDGPYASDRNLVVDNIMGASRERPELTSSWGGPVGRGNVARGNCVAPGLAEADGGGFRAFDNRVTDGPACFSSAPERLTTALEKVAPALVDRLLR